MLIILKPKDNNNYYFTEIIKKLNKQELSILERITNSKLLTDYSVFNNIHLVGPKKSFITPWSSNVITILKKIGFKKVIRIEQFRIFNGNLDPITEKKYCQVLKTLNNRSKKHSLITIPYSKAKEFIKNHNLGISDSEINYYYQYLFKDREPTELEIYDLSQSNSEHSRHTFFNGKLHINSIPISKTLMDFIKEPLEKNRTNSLVAFKDNSSCQYGGQISNFVIRNGRYFSGTKIIHSLFTAETHNFPTAVSPFHGASTGIGGRIRDVQALGRGAQTIAGTAGYCVGNIEELTSLETKYPRSVRRPLEILIEASNGASDYGNKFGEPIIQGFTRSFYHLDGGLNRWEWMKPIMFTGGIGQIYQHNVKKLEPILGDLIVKIGGPAYKIGFCGGSYSSNQHKNNLGAVQRGDPEVEQKMNRVIRACTEMKHNPIKSIHDQGAGGNGNVIKEIVYPCGGTVNIDNITKGDSSLSPVEIWISEYQEQNALIIDSKDKSLLEEIAKRENVCVDFIGTISNTNHLQVIDNNNNLYADFDLDGVMNLPQKNYRLKPIQLSIPQFNPSLIMSKELIYQVLSLVDVGSKRFLTNKVDRSVGGLICQQQCVGPYQTPLANVSIVAHSYFDKIGIASAIGERPYLGLIDVEKMVSMCVGEMLTNLMWARISNFENIKCSCNWMWPANSNEERYLIYLAMKKLSSLLTELGIACDGGKDSLSMSVTHLNKNVKSPRTLVVSGYVGMSDITKKITPDLKGGSINYLVLIDMSPNYNCLGGSSLYRTMNQIGGDCPYLVSAKMLKQLFNIIQIAIDNNYILSGHDRSDGGLITTLIEMSISGSVGININGKGADFWFNEGLGVVLEIRKSHFNELYKLTKNYGIKLQILGYTTNKQTIVIKSNDKIVFDEPISDVRMAWEESSLKLEKYQTNNDCVEQERKWLKSNTKLTYKANPNLLNKHIFHNYRPKVAIIRDEGSNGDREMAGAFYKVGFEVYDVMIGDLSEDKIDLNIFRGIVFVGGFTFSDVLNAGKGWYSLIRYNKKILKMFENFYKKDSTFSLGICNGCQLMAQLLHKFGLIPKVKIIKNNSQRFESRYSTVKIVKDNNIFLKNFKDSVLPIWVANAEGKFITENLDDLCPIYYVDNNHQPTELYPFNPSGSINGIAGITTKCGRHLLMMPHPERTFLEWQLAYNPQKWNKSPWLKMFENIYNWCHQSKK